jgi:predicted O-methyltransferase YrrM
MNQVLREALDSGRISDEAGRSYPITGISIPADEGRYLQHLIREHRPKITLEIGCAFGISSLFICEALRDVGGSKHIMIDAWSEASRVAAANLNRAGYGGLFEQHIKLSFEALTELRAKGTIIDLAFLDGMHTFDYVLVDFFLTDKLLRSCGIVVIDDYSWPAIYKVCRYVMANLPYQFIGPLVDEQPSVKQRLARHVSSLYPFSKISRPEFRDPHLMGLPSPLATRYIALRKLSEDRIGTEAGCNRCWDSHAEF